MSNVSMKLSEFQKFNSENILEYDVVREKVVELYNMIWGQGGESFIERETQNFLKIIRESKALKACTAFSVYTCMIDLAVTGLTVEPGAQAMAYLIPRNVCIGKSPNNGQDIYEARCQLKISGYGELSMRTASGQILYADNPIIVYDNDDFSCSVSGDVKNVEYKCNLPHKGHQIIGCFVRIVRPDHSVDYSWLLEEEIERLKGYSYKANRKWNERERKWELKANDLYSSNDGQIDSGFLIAKTIKHAFKTYPKLRIGKYTSLQSDDNTQDPAMDIYQVQQPEQDRPFGPDVNNIAQGVRIEPKDTDQKSDDTPF